MLKDNNLLLWFATFALIAVVSCGAGIGGELIEENNTKSKDSFENKTTYKKKKWFNSPSGFNKRNSSSAKIKYVFFSKGLLEERNSLARFGKC